MRTLFLLLFLLFFNLTEPFHEDNNVNNVTCFCLVIPSSTLSILSNYSITRKLKTFPICSFLSSQWKERIYNLSPLSPIWHPRAPVPHLLPQPSVALAVVFQYSVTPNHTDDDAQKSPPGGTRTLLPRRHEVRNGGHGLHHHGGDNGSKNDEIRTSTMNMMNVSNWTMMAPVYKIAMPMYYSQNHIKQTLSALLEKTTGVWALDVIVDFSLDNSLLSTLQAIVFHLRKLSAVNQFTKITSFPTVIRIIVSDGYPLFECQAENLAFSTDSEAEYYLSVQADILVKERGWNELLTLPLAIFDDVFSVSGHCAHNLRAPMNSNLTSLENDWHSVGHCRPNDLRPNLANHHWSKFKFYNKQGNDLRQFHVRETSNRGPLLFRGSMMRSLGFFDELNWLNSNDDHDIHLRAYIEGRWVTGFFNIPFEHIQRDKKLEEIRRTKLQLRHQQQSNKTEPSQSSSPNRTSHVAIQKEVIESFIRNRDGGYTGWKYQQHPILDRNRSFYKELFLRQRIVPLQERARQRGIFAYQMAQLPLREETRRINDKMLQDAKAIIEQHTAQRFGRVAK